MTGIDQPFAARLVDSLTMADSAAQCVVEVLRQYGAADSIRTFPEPVPTAAAAAEAVGCEVGAIANSLVFVADGEPLLVLASGAHRVDTKRVAELVGAAKVKRADRYFVHAATGQQAGAVAPVGHPAPIRTVIDTCLAKYDRIWAGAGHENSVFATSFEELVRMTAAITGEVG